MALQMRIGLHGRVHVHVASLGGTLKALVLEQLVVTAMKAKYKSSIFSNSMFNLPLTSSH